MTTARRGDVARAESFVAHKKLVIVFMKHNITFQGALDSTTHHIASCRQLVCEGDAPLSETDEQLILKTRFCIIEILKILSKLMGSPRKTVCRSHFRRISPRFLAGLPLLFACCK